MANLPANAKGPPTRSSAAALTLLFRACLAKDGEGSDEESDSEEERARLDVIEKVNILQQSVSIPFVRRDCLSAMTAS